MSVTITLRAMVLSEETIKTVLKNAGLTEKEAIIYILIAKHEPLSGTEIAKLTKKDKAQVFRILKKLLAKSVIETTLEFPTRYTVIPFESILEMVVKSKRDEISSIEKNREALVEQLKKKSPVEYSLEKFTLIKGAKKINSRISKIIKATKHQLSVATSLESFLRFDRSNFFDMTLGAPSRSKIEYRFLIEMPKEKLYSAKALAKVVSKNRFIFKVTDSDFSLNVFPRMVARDNEEIVFFISIPGIADVNNDDVVLWTNSKSLVHAFTTVFEDSWRNASDLQNKISEIETGEPIAKTCVIKDAIVARSKYEEILESTKQEIVFMTSSKNLVGYLKNLSRIKYWVNNGISVRIMAPIVSDNFKVAKKISRICEVKHIPICYPEAAIIDGKHFFQFKNLTLEQTNNPVSNFIDTFYTNDIEYVEKMKKMFDDLWHGSFAPSPVTLEAIFEKSKNQQKEFSSSELKPAYLRSVSGLSFNDKMSKQVATEREVLNKIIDFNTFSRKNNPNIPLKLHGCTGNAVIHPPQDFKLPSIVITIFHIEKQSSFGAEDAMLIYLWLETSKGPAYVPVAYAGDNAKAQLFWKTLMKNTPAAQNIQLLKKDELQVRVHGNTLFAGWARAIPLLPTKYILPPACILIEGYGGLKTDTFTLTFPSGYKSEIERNGFEAFVTFFHPSSKYSGPGTDGFFARDYVANTYPPS